MTNNYKMNVNTFDGHRRKGKVSCFRNESTHRRHTQRHILLPMATVLNYEVEDPLMTVNANDKITVLSTDVQSMDAVGVQLALNDVSDSRLSERLSNQGHSIAIGLTSVGDMCSIIDDYHHLMDLRIYEGEVEEHPSDNMACCSDLTLESYVDGSQWDHGVDRWSNLYSCPNRLSAHTGASCLNWVSSVVRRRGYVFHQHELTSTIVCERRIKRNRRMKNKVKSGLSSQNHNGNDTLSHRKDINEVIDRKHKEGYLSCSTSANGAMCEGSTLLRKQENGDGESCIHCYLPYVIQHNLYPNIGVILSYSALLRSSRRSRQLKSLDFNNARDSYTSYLSSYVSLRGHRMQTTRLAEVVVGCTDDASENRKIELPLYVRRALSLIMCDKDVVNDSNAIRSQAPFGPSNSRTHVPKGQSDLSVSKRILQEESSGNTHAVIQPTPRYDINLFQQLQPMLSSRNYNGTIMRCDTHSLCCVIARFIVASCIMNDYIKYLIKYNKFSDCLNLYGDTEPAAVLTTPKNRFQTGSLLEILSVTDYSASKTRVNGNVGRSMIMSSDGDMNPIGNITNVCIDTDNESLLSKRLQLSNSIPRLSRNCNFSLLDVIAEGASATDCNSYFRSSLLGSFEIFSKIILCDTGHMQRKMGLSSEFVGQSKSLPKVKRKKQEGPNERNKKRFSSYKRGAVCLQNNNIDRDSRHKLKEGGVAKSTSLNKGITNNHKSVVSCLSMENERKRKQGELKHTVKDSITPSRRAVYSRKCIVSYTSRPSYLTQAKGRLVKVWSMDGCRPTAGILPFLHPGERMSEMSTLFSSDIMSHSHSPQLLGVDDLLRVSPSIDEAVRDPQCRNVPSQRLLCQSKTVASAVFPSIVNKTVLVPDDDDYCNSNSIRSNSNHKNASYSKMPMSVTVDTNTAATIKPSVTYDKEDEHVIINTSVKEIEETVAEFTVVDAIIQQASLWAWLVQATVPRDLIGPLMSATSPLGKKSQVTARHNQSQLCICNKDNNSRPSSRRDENCYTVIGGTTTEVSDVRAISTSAINILYATPPPLRPLVAVVIPSSHCQGHGSSTHQDDVHQIAESPNESYGVFSKEYARGEVTEVYDDSHHYPSTPLRVPLSSFGQSHLCRTQDCNNNSSRIYSTSNARNKLSCYRPMAVGQGCVSSIKGDEYGQTVRFMPTTTTTTDMSHGECSFLMFPFVEALRRYYHVSWLIKEGLYEYVFPMASSVRNLREGVDTPLLDKELKSSKNGVKSILTLKENEIKATQRLLTWMRATDYYQHIIDIVGLKDIFLLSRMNTHTGECTPPEYYMSKDVQKDSECSSVIPTPKTSKVPSFCLFVSPATPQDSDLCVPTMEIDHYNEMLSNDSDVTSELSLLSDSDISSENKRTAVHKMREDILSKMDYDIKYREESCKLSHGDVDCPESIVNRVTNREVPQWAADVLLSHKSKINQSSTTSPICVDVLAPADMCNDIPHTTYDGHSQQVSDDFCNNNNNNNNIKPSLRSQRSSKLRIMTVIQHNKSYSPYLRHDISDSDDAQYSSSSSDTADILIPEAEEVNEEKKKTTDITESVDDNGKVQMLFDHIGLNRTEHKIRKNTAVLTSSQEEVHFAKVEVMRKEVKKRGLSFLRLRRRDKSNAPRRAEYNDSVKATGKCGPCALM